MYPHWSRQLASALAPMCLGSRAGHPSGSVLWQRSRLRGAGAAVAFSTELPLVPRVVVAMAAALAGFLVLLLVLLVPFLILAPFRQRNEARVEIRRLTAPRDEVSERIRAAQGSALVPKHEAQLAVFLESVQLAVLNGRAVLLGNNGRSDEQNLNSFMAHFPPLAVPINDWQEAVQQHKDAKEHLQQFVPVKAREHGLVAPKYDADAAIAGLAEAVEYRWIAQRQSGPEEVSVSVVERPRAPDTWPIWAVCFNSGMREYTIAEVEISVEDRDDDGLDQVQRQLPQFEKELSATLTALLQSDEAEAVIETYRVVRALQDEIREPLQRYQVSFSPKFAEECAFCLTAIGVDC